MSVAPASLTRHAGPSRDRGPPCSSQPNVWRDINLTDRLAVYSGGGIGGGGYDYNLVNQLSAGPFTETWSESASEMLFTLRVYEPFRGWRR